MTCKEHHRFGCHGVSLEGCWKLAGGNTSGHRAIMTPRPGGAPEERKVSQGMEAQTRLDLGCGITSTSHPHLPKLAGQLTQSHPVLPDPKPTEPAKNRVKLNQKIRRHLFRLLPASGSITTGRSRKAADGKWRCHRCHIDFGAVSGNLI
jgi:hypothetical protein